MKITARALISALLAILWTLPASLLPASSATTATTAVRIALMSGDDTGEPYYAQDSGIFVRHGLIATIDGRLGGRAAIDSVKSSANDVAFANVVSVAAAIQAGDALVMLAPASLYRAAFPGSMLVQAPTSNFHTGADLNGKTIDSPSGKGSLGALGPQVWIDKNGGDSTTVKMVSGIPLKQIPAALRAGTIDAGEMTEPEKSVMLRAGEVKIIAPTFDAIAPEFLLGCWVASKRWVHDNPAAARQFVAAIRETAIWANTHHDATAAILAKCMTIEPAILATMTRSQFALDLTAAELQPVIDVAAKYGIMKPMEARALITPLP